MAMMRRTDGPWILFHMIRDMTALYADRLKELPMVEHMNLCGGKVAILHYEAEPALPGIESVLMLPMAKSANERIKTPPPSPPVPKRVISEDGEERNLALLMMSQQ